MIETKDIHWLAGLLEGEGCFALEKNNGSNSKSHNPRITVAMTDKDVIDRAASILHTKVILRHRPGPTGKWKDTYWARIGGNGAIQRMMTLYPLMGVRKQGRIRKAIAHWKTTLTKSEYVKAAWARGAYTNRDIWRTRRVI